MRSVTLLILRDDALDSYLDFGEGGKHKIPREYLDGFDEGDLVEIVVTSRDVPIWGMMKEASFQATV